MTGQDAIGILIAAVIAVPLFWIIGVATDSLCEWIARKGRK